MCISMCISNTLCILSLSVDPNTIHIEFGNDDAAIQFMKTIQNHLSIYHAPFSAPLGGGYIQEGDNKNTVTKPKQQHLSLASATHGIPRSL